MRNCAEKSCDIRASFGYEGESPKFCAKHKEPEMINLEKRICDNKFCKKEANFGFKHNFFDYIPLVNFAKSMQI